MAGRWTCEKAQPETAPETDVGWVGGWVGGIVVEGGGGWGGSGRSEELQQPGEQKRGSDGTAPMDASTRPVHRPGPFIGPARSSARPVHRPSPFIGPARSSARPVRGPDGTARMGEAARRRAWGS
jgi:hypothetical protein